ncbi:MULTISPECIES: hypothetical protein [Vibrio]|nr:MULTISPECIES: hypothetical protein [Vibrio]MEC7309589.1 hypothetical protein [Vibrio crassostreae]OEF82102.1 hypothetical protein A162_01700 [Vibrio tasmaniensis 1F-155]
MSIQELKLKLSKLQEQRQALDHDRRSAKPDQLRERKQKHTQLERNVTDAQNALNQVFSEDDVAEAKSMFDRATAELEACEVVIRNLETFISSTSVLDLKVLQEEIEDIKQQIINSLHDDIVGQIKEIPAETIELLKDYVIVSQSGTSSPKGRYGLGSGVTQVFGELRSDDFRAYQKTFEEKFGFSL